MRFYENKTYNLLYIYTVVQVLSAGVFMVSSLGNVYLAMALGFILIYGNFIYFRKKFISLPNSEDEK